MISASFNIIKDLLYTDKEIFKSLIISFFNCDVINTSPVLYLAYSKNFQRIFTADKLVKSYNIDIHLE